MDQERLDRLEKRVDKLEEQIAVHLQRIFEALEELKVNSATTSSEFEHTIKSHNATLLRVERIELKILEMERQAITEARHVERQFARIETQKAWVLGAWSVVALASSIIGALSMVVIKYWIDK